MHTGVPFADRLTSILAELGADMSRFPTAQHAASWVGLVLAEAGRAEPVRAGRFRQWRVADRAWIAADGKIKEWSDYTIRMERG